MFDDTKHFTGERKIFKVSSTDFKMKVSYDTVDESMGEAIDEFRTVYPEHFKKCVNWDHAKKNVTNAEYNFLAFERLLDKHRDY